MPAENELRRHLEHVRKFKRYALIYVLSLVVLTPVWVVTQYLDQDGWPKHLSSRSRYAGDWDPWIIWVAAAGAIVVAVVGIQAYLDRPAARPRAPRKHLGAR